MTFKILTANDIKTKLGGTWVGTTSSDSYNENDPSDINSEMLKGIDILKENVTFWMENFEDISFTEGGGLPGTDIGFWGGNVYPTDQAMSGPNNVRMYGTWNVTNSNTGKAVSFKHYLVWNFNEDGKVHTVTEYADVGGLLSTFDQ